MLGSHFKDGKSVVICLAKNFITILYDYLIVTVSLFLTDKSEFQSILKNE